jgi:hypothetical protein
VQDKETELQSFLELISKKKFTIDESQTELSIEEEQEYSSPSDDDNDKSASIQISEKAKEQVNKLKIANEKLKIDNDNLKKLAEHRIKYSWAIFIFVICFVSVSLGIVILSGLNILCLSDTILGALQGTNMVQVIGVLYIVTKWLYPANGNGKK